MLTLCQAQPGILRLPPDLFLGEPFAPAERDKGSFGAFLPGLAYRDPIGTQCPRKLLPQPGVNKC